MRENLTYGLMRGQRVKPLAYSTFTGTPFQVLFRVYQMPYELNSNCVTVVTAEGYSGQLLISGFSRLLTRLCTVVDYTRL